MSKSQEKKIKLKPKSSYNNEYSNLTKIPKRPIVIIPKTPEEVAQEIEGLRMHMADQLQEESKNDLKEDFKASEGLFKYLNPNAPTFKEKEKTDFDIIVSDKITQDFRKSIHETSQELFNKNKLPSPEFLLGKIDELLTKRDTEKEYESIYNHARNNHYLEKNEWLAEKNHLLNERSSLKERNLELENLLTLEYQNTYDLKDRLEKAQKLKSDDLLLFLNQNEKIKTLEKKLADKTSFLKDLQDEKFELQVDLEEAKESIIDLNQKNNDLKDHINKNFLELSALYEDKFKLEKNIKYKNDLLTSNLRFWELLQESYKTEIKDLKEQLEDGYSKYKESQKLLSSKEDELFESQKKIEVLSDVISNQNNSIRNLSNELFKYKFKEITSYSFFIKNELLPYLKNSGVLYFCIWLVVWFFILGLILGF